MAFLGTIVNCKDFASFAWKVDFLSAFGAESVAKAQANGLARAPVLGTGKFCQTTGCWPTEPSAPGALWSPSRRSSRLLSWPKRVKNLFFPILLIRNRSIDLTELANNLRPVLRRVQLMRSFRSGNNCPRLSVTQRKGWRAHRFPGACEFDLILFEILQRVRTLSERLMKEKKSFKELLV